MAKQKLTTSDVSRMREMRMEGMSYRDISAQFPVSPQRVYRLTRDVSPNPSKKEEYANSRVKRIVYPNIKAYCERNQLSFFDFADALRVSDRGLARFLVDGRGCNKETIDRILAETGLTYEEAFFREGGSG